MRLEEAEAYHESPDYLKMDGPHTKWLISEVKRVRCIAEDLWVYIHSNASIDLSITAKQMEWFVCPKCLGGLDECKDGCIEERDEK